MRLDHDLARTILLECEEGLSRAGVFRTYYAEKDFNRFYTVKKMIEAGYLLGSAYNAGAQSQMRVIEITYAGHLFIDTIRDDKLWRKAQEGAKSMGGVGLDLMKDLVTGFAKTQIKRLTNVEID